MDSSSQTELIQRGPEWFEAGLAYRYEMPEGPGPYPTVVMLHGRLGNEDVMWVFRKVVPRSWLVVAPRAPLADEDYFSWYFQERGEWPDLTVFEPAVKSLERFIRALPRLYNADPDRIYLMGFSQGAAVSLATALQRPELVRGVAGLVGFVPSATEEEVSGRLQDMPVFLAAGTGDKTVPIEVARQAQTLLEHSGADVEYHEFESGHKMPSAGMQALRKWFFSQT